TNQDTDAYCFTLQDIARPKVKGRRLRQFDNRMLMGSITADDTGRFVLAPFRTAFGAPRQLFKIWDLQAAGEKGAVSDPVTVVVPFAEGFDVFPNPRSTSVVLRGRENSLRWLNLASPDTVPPLLRGHDGLVTAVAYSDEGRWLLTGCEDGTIRSWNLNPLSTS